MKSNKLMTGGCLGLALGLSCAARAVDEASSDLSLNDIFDIKVTTASKVEEFMRDAPATLAVVTADEIKSYGALSLVDVLNRVASLYVMDTYFIRKNIVSIRGDMFTHYNSRVLVLVDGRPARESITYGINVPFYSAYPVDRIERIEVIRGPGSVLYGTSAFTGVINIINKDAEEQKTSSWVRYGSFNALQGAVATGQRLGGVNVAGGAQYYRDSGWKYVAKDEKSVLQSKRSLEHDFGANLKVDYKDLTLNSFYGLTSADSMGMSSIWKNGSKYANIARRGLVDLGYKHGFNDAWTLGANVTWNHMTQQQRLENAQDDELRSDSNDFLFELTNFISPSPDMHVIVGALANVQNGEYIEPNANGSDGSPFDAQSAVNPDPWYLLLPYRHVTWYSAYAQIDYRLTKWLKVVAGEQANKSSSPIDYVPRLAAIFDLSDRWGAKLMYGKAFRSPSAFERGSRAIGANIGDPDLLPETISTSEASVSYRERSYDLTATYFYSHEVNLITRSRPDEMLPVWQGVHVAWPKWINRGNQDAHGGELEGKFRVTEDLTLQLAYSHQTNKNTVLGSDSTGIPKTMIKAGVDYNRKDQGLRASLYNSYFGKGGDLKPSLPGLNPGPGAYSFLTLNVGVDLDRWVALGKLAHWKLDLYGTNLLNASIDQPDYSRKKINSFPAGPGRAVYATVGAVF